MRTNSRGSSPTGLASAATLLVASVLACVVLVRARPHLAGPPPAWRGDDLALAATWLVATVCAAWLALTTGACLVALARGEVGVAARIAGCAPPVARGFLRAALVGSIVLTPAAAHGATEPAREVPVVRAPPSPSSSSSSSVPTATTTTAAPPPTPRTAAPPRPAPAAVTTGPAHLVRAGDNLWRIAEAEVMRRNTGTAKEADVARYWQRVIAANRTTLRSGDPSLIFPGEIVTLPLD